MPAVVLPLKVFQTLAPAIKGYGGVAREVRFEDFVNVFKRHWGCSVRPCKRNSMLVIPPKNSGKWPFPQRGFKVYKPSTSRLNRQDLWRVRNMLHEAYGWDARTFVCSPRR